MPVSVCRCQVPVVQILSSKDFYVRGSAVKRCFTLSVYRSICVCHDLNRALLTVPELSQK